MLRFRKLFSLVLVLLVALGIQAQDFPYELDLQKELGLFSVSSGLSVGSHIMENQMDGLDPYQLSRKRRHHVWFLDRGATRNESDQFRVLSDDLVRGAMLLPATLATSKSARSRPLILATMLAETMLLNDGLTKFTKVLIRRSRPLTFNEAFGEESQRSNDARQSFVSGHTSNAAALSFFTAKVFHDLYPESPWRPVVWAGAAALPLLTGYSRYRAGKHFPTDIVAGYALGAVLGVMIPECHKRDDQKGLQLGVTGEGIGLTLRW